MNCPVKNQFRQYGDFPILLEINDKHTIPDLNISIHKQQHVVLHKKNLRGGQMRSSDETIQQLEERIRLLEETNNNGIADRAASYIASYILNKTPNLIKNTAKGALIGASIEWALATFLLAVGAIVLVYDACTNEKYNPLAGVPRNEGNSACPLALFIGLIGIPTSPFVAAQNPTGYGFMAGAAIGFLHGLYKKTISNNREERNQIEHRPT